MAIDEETKTRLDGETLYCIVYRRRYAEQVMAIEA